jgi:hypothetical protein
MRHRTATLHTPCTLAGGVSFCRLNNSPENWGVAAHHRLDFCSNI